MLWHKKQWATLRCIKAVSSHRCERSSTPPAQSSEPATNRQHVRHRHEHDEQGKSQHASLLLPLFSHLTFWAETIDNFTEPLIRGTAATVTWQVECWEFYCQSEIRLTLAGSTPSSLGTSSVENLSEALLFSKQFLAVVVYIKDSHILMLLLLKHSPSI